MGLYLRGVADTDERPPEQKPAPALGARSAPHQVPTVPTSDGLPRPTMKTSSCASAPAQPLTARDGRRDRDSREEQAGAPCAAPAP